MVCVCALILYPPYIYSSEPQVRTSATDLKDQLGGVEEEKDSEEESGEVPGLFALFSACTSTDAYSVVSVRDFLCVFIWN